MKCMKCNSNLTESGYCNQCGFNISHLIKSKNTSGWYYNRALEKAKNRELSNAAALLEIALSFDKENIDARNLLGLIYHEMGQIAKAMHQWVISINIDIEDNIAIKYLQQYQEDEHAMQKIDRGVNLYNQTLYSARLGKEGMALLKIEECCFVIPNFVDAHLLRALLYMNKKDWEQAKKAIKDVLKIDRYNPTAVRYLKEIPEYNIDKGYKDALNALLPEVKKEEKKEIVKATEHEKGKEIKKETKKEAVKEEKKEKTARGYVKIIGGLVAGIMMGVIIMWAMLVPMNQSFEEQFNYVKNQINQNTAQANPSKSTESEKENGTTQDTQDTKDTQVTAEIVDYTGKDDKKGIMDYMIIAMGHYKDGNAVKAAKALIKVDEDMLKSDSSKEKYDEIKKSTFGEASTQLYNSGMELYNERNYDEAAKDFKLAYKIDDSNVEAYYFLGLCYQNTDQVEKAKEVYEEINNKFKGSDREHDAKDRLRQMGY
ncbi:MAG: tetratricopeptide repeat protein [Lachnospiraceae bacterium]